MSKKIRNRILSFTTAITMMFSMLLILPQDMAWATGGTLNGDGSSDSPYEIADADDLKAFADKVNGGETSACAILTADIVLNQNVLNENGELNGDGTGLTEWKPIGKESDQTYNGKFDGQDHTISGLYINSALKCVGLFGLIDSGGAVQNVGVIDSYISSSLREAYAGGIAGANNGGAISNCYITGSVSASTGNTLAGGIVGYNYSGTISGCYNTGTISGSYNVGGIAGDNIDTISGCYNTGAVNGSDDISYAGGIAGLNRSGTISVCYNTGAVSGSDNAGGIAGENDGTISVCYNTGAVSGSYDAGGIAGYSYSGTISGCYNTGTISGSDDTSYAGGIAGENNQGTISGCFYLADSETDEIDGTTFKTSDQFKSGEAAYLLQNALGENAEQVWGQNIGADPFPKLTADYHVYCVKYKSCDDAAEEKIYSNTNEDVVYNSEYDENGFCSICGEGQPAVPGSDGVYEISNAGQLYWFAKLVNGGETSANAKLMNDIVINENVLNENGELNGDGSAFTEWTPIGNTGKKYTGTFDGQNYTISGLYINSKIRYAGLFGYVNSGGTVQNVGVIDSYISSSDYLAYSGGIAGLNDGTISGCYNTGNISANCAGGIAGYNNSGTISDCYNTGAVSDSDYAGGIAGRNRSGTISVCYNTGSVSDSYNAGGITGYSYSGTISGCYNTGTISGSYNVGGGIVGENNSTISGCYNTGAVSGSDDISYAGGIAGENNSIISGCFYLADSETDEIDGTTFKTAEQFKIGEAAYLLQGEQEEEIWGQEIGKDIAPVLGGVKVYSTNGCIGYSNTENDYTEHPGTYDEDGNCTVCGKNVQPTITLNENTFTYNGKAIDTDGLVKSDSSSDLTLTWKSGEDTLDSAPVDAGKYQLTVSVEDDGIYGKDTVAFEVEITQATPEIKNVTVSIPDNTLDVSKVTFKSDTTVKGKFELKNGTVIEYGKNEIGWVFTPEDSKNYKTVDGKATLTANKIVTTTTTAKPPVETTTTTKTNPTTTKPVSTSAAKPVTTVVSKVTTVVSKPVTTVVSKVTTVVSKPATTVVSKPITTIVSKPATTVVSKPATTVVSKPVTTVVSKPATTVVSKPITTVVSKPVTTVVSKPATTVVSKPVTTVVSKPVTTVVSKPVTTVVSKPVTTVVSKPVTTVVSKPVTTVVSKPITTVVSKPATTVVTKPVTTVVSKPATTVVSKPVTTVVSKPVTTVVSKPVTTVVSKPVTTVISKPATTVVSKPATTVVSKPVTTVVSKPATTVVSKPVTTIVSKPVTTVVSKPATTIVSKSITTVASKPVTTIVSKPATTVVTKLSTTSVTIIATTTSVTSVTTGKSTGTTTTTVITIDTSTVTTVSTSMTTEPSVTTAPTVTTKPTETEVPGDVDGDGDVDLYDAIIVCKCMIHAKDVTEEQKNNADVDGNGKIDLYDAIYIAEYMIGKHK